MWECQRCWHSDFSSSSFAALNTFTRKESATGTAVSHPIKYRYKIYHVRKYKWKNFQGHQAWEPASGRAWYPEVVWLWDGYSVPASGQGATARETLWHSSIHCSRDLSQVSYGVKKCKTLMFPIKSIFMLCASLLSNVSMCPGASIMLSLLISGPAALSW